MNKIRPAIECIQDILNNENSFVCDSSNVDLATISSITVNHKELAVPEACVASMLGIPQHFSRRLWDARESAWQNVFLALKDSSPQLYFRTDKARTKVLGVSSFNLKLVNKNFQVPLLQVFQTLQNDGFETVRFKYNEHRGLVEAEFNFDAQIAQPVELKIGDTDIFTRLLRVEMDLNAANKVMMSDELLRMVCTNRATLIDKSFRKHLFFRTSNIPGDVRNVIDSMKDGVNSFFLFKKIQDISDPNKKLSIRELEIFANHLSSRTFKDDAGSCILPNKDKTFPVLDEVARQGFSATEYADNPGILSDAWKAVAQTSVPIYDAWNFITWNSSNNVAVDTDQRETLTMLASSFLSASRKWDCMHVIRMPQYLFN